MRLFKISRDVLNLSPTFNPTVISQMFPPGHPNQDEKKKYQEAIGFYYAISAQTRGSDQATKARIFNECGKLLNDIKTEPLDSLALKLNAKIEEIKGMKLSVRPLK